MLYFNKEVIKKSIENKFEIIEEVIKFETKNNQRKEYNIILCPNFNFKNKDYYFAKFSHLSIYSKERLTIEGITFRYCEFINCIFRNIEFLKCNFIGCFFEECEFGIYDQKIIFLECKFTGVSRSSRMNSLNIYTGVHMNCSIKKSKIFAYFQQNTDMTSLTIDNTDIFFIEIKDSYCNGVTIMESNINNCLIDSCFMKKFVVSDCKVINFQIEDTNRTTMFDSATALVDIKPSDIFIYQKDNYSSRLFHTFANQFKQNKFEIKYGEYFYKAKKCEIREARKLERIKLILADLTCGFGEKPFNALISSLLIIFIFGVVYYFSGLKVDDKLLSYSSFSLNNSTFSGMIGYFLNCINFSIVTFTTVGYGNIVPHNMSKFFSSVEMFLGVVFIALYTSTLVRKMTR